VQWSGQPGHGTAAGSGERLSVRPVCFGVRQGPLPSVLQRVHGTTTRTSVLTISLPHWPSSHLSQQCPGLPSFSSDTRPAACFNPAVWSAGGLCGPDEALQPDAAAGRDRRRQDVSVGKFVQLKQLLLENLPSASSSTSCPVLQRPLNSLPPLLQRPLGRPLRRPLRRSASSSVAHIPLPRFCHNSTLFQPCILPFFCRHSATLLPQFHSFYRDSTTILPGFHPIDFSRLSE